VGIQVAYLGSCRFLSAVSVLLAGSALWAATPDPADKSPAVPLTVGLPGEVALETDGKLAVQVVLTNTSEKQVAAEVEFQVQQDAALYSKPAPHPLYGADVAGGARSWTETAGKVYENTSMTDGKTWTDFGTPWGKWTESFVYIDLGKARHVTHMGYRSGDANWAWKVDFSAGADGKDYQPVDGLQGVDFYKKWGPQEIDVPRPFEARFLRLRFHKGGEETPSLRYPSEFYVYSGATEETWAFPQVGAKVLLGKLSRAVPAKGVATVEIGDGRTLSPGAYLAALRTKAGGLTQMSYGHIFVMPPALEKVTAAGRFGMNVADPKYAKILRREGNAWVRFENLKWPFVSPEPGVYKFDGTVPPWNVKLDDIFRTYHEAGLFTMPYLFLTPKYLVPEKPKGDPMTNPPKDLGRYAEFAFQAAARYGARKHPADVLLTPDKVSGLGYIDTYELWNEPNLDDPGWGSWKGPLSDYYVMYRAGAEAVKKADPAAKVANAGWSGIDVPLMEGMRTFKYPDGKCPLDFTDVLSVHYYSFRIAPELATVNDNTHREGVPERGRTYEEDLERLVAWRDKTKPALPVWLTETGYDSGGPRGVDERLQACWLVRDVMMVLASGIDKVLVFREKGSGGNLFAASGVIRDDDSLKPAWFTYATVIRQLDGVTQRALKVPFEDENVRVYLWKRGEKPIVTAWAIEGTAKLNLPLGRCTVTDAFGASQAADIRQPLDLTDFPVYLTDFADPAGVKRLEEQARQMAEKERRRVERLSKLQAYLFDFGSMDRVGTLTIGVERPFTPVVAADLYDEARGYGFETKGLSDSVEKWYRNPLTEDSVRVGPGARFTFKAKPGDYVLQVCARPHEASQVTIRGAEGGDRVLKVPTGGDAVRAAVKVGAKPLTVETHFYGALVWLSLVQDDGSK
jgi:hypothetical protein